MPYSATFLKSFGWPGIKKPGKKERFIWLLVLWFLVNLLQATFTEINPDEAYYFLYGKYLSWGFFDHPPMVALMVRISSWFFSGNLGVRFMTVLLQSGTLTLVWLQLDRKENGDKQPVLFFFIISASLALFAIYGFTTTPDAPLLFFTALYLYAYKEFLKRDSWINSFIIALAVAGLIYSKYQGFLVICFVILSNIRLLNNYKLWVAFLLALALCIPHFYWQYSHGFITFKYHLISRSNPFSWWPVLKYIPDQVFSFNPFTLGAVMYVLFKYRPSQKFERALYFVIFGFLGFFWFSTIRDKVEPQWTVAASIPMIVLLNNRITTDDKLRNYTRVYISGSLILVLIARIMLAASMIPNNYDLSKKEPRFRAIEMVAKQRPVVFSGSYQSPSLYSFFTGKPSTVISSIKTRQTQFDIWRLEQNWDDQPVFIHGFFVGKSKNYSVSNCSFEGFFADSLQITNSLEINFNSYKDSFKAGEPVSIHFTISNPTKRDINFANPGFPVKLKSIINGKGGQVEIEGTLETNIEWLKSGGVIHNVFKFNIPSILKGESQLGMGCNTIHGTTLNSEYKKFIVY